MDVLLFVAFGVVVSVILMIGGRAERFNLRGLTRPLQPRYREGKSQRSRAD